MYIAQEIAARIKAQSKFADISIKDMLSDLEMGINTISELSKGKQISYVSFAKIADYLDCSVDYLLGRSDVANNTASETTNELLQQYATLNETGKNKMRSYLTDLLSNPQNTSSTSSIVDDMLRTIQTVDKKIQRLTTNGK